MVVFDIVFAASAPIGDCSWDCPAVVKEYILAAVWSFQANRRILE
jgi:hypothetical protein